MNDIHSTLLTSLQKQAALRNSRRVGRVGGRGFTLIELLVVIAIIIVLVGLTVTVAVGLTASSDKRDAELILTHMNTALEEWERANGRSLTYGQTGQTPHGFGATYDFDQNTYGTGGGTPQLHSAFLKVLLRNPQAADQLAKIGKDRFTREADGDPVIVDPWDQRIQVVFPGRKWLAAVGFAQGDNPDIKDEDGTVRHSHENKFGICVREKITFISFGPDQQAGDRQIQIAPGSRDQRLLALANDNLYSAPMLTEKPNP